MQRPLGQFRFDSVACILCDLRRDLVHSFEMVNPNTLAALVQEQETPEARLWGAVAAHAVACRQWWYFESDNSTFPLVCAALNWDPEDVRELVERKRAKIRHAGRARMPQDERTPKGEDDTTCRGVGMTWFSSGNHV